MTDFELKSFLANLILESKYEMMDISIKQLSKEINTEEKIRNFLEDNIEIQSKEDGIKCTLIHTANTGDYKRDWIVAYKGTIIYPSEVDKLGDIDKVEKEGIGESQFSFIWDKLKKANYKSLPISQEFFVEFLVKKPTVMSNYSKLDGVLLASSKTTYEAKHGKLVSHPQDSFNTDNIEQYAKILGLKTIPVLFRGKLSKLPEGILDPRLKTALSKEKLDKSNPKEYLDSICKALLSLDSKFGGKAEGVVFKTSENKLYKIQQDYQLDRAKRDEKKAQYQGTEEEESSYIDKVNSTAREVATNILDSLSDKELYDEDLKVDKLSSAISKLKLSFSHPKKTELQIKEDILRSAKTFMFANTKGNKNFLFLGKFRILQNAHYNIIKSALRQYDKGVVCLVSSKDTKGTEKLRLEMLERAFGDRIKVITHPTGNIWGILGKSPLQISTIFCGTDRYDDYKKQVSKSTIEVKEIKRDLETGLSASKVIANIDDEEFFKKNTPKEIHSMYPEIRAVYSRESLKESLKHSMFDLLKKKNLF